MEQWARQHHLFSLISFPTSPHLPHHLPSISSSLSSSPFNITTSPSSQSQLHRISLISPPPYSGQPPTLYCTQTLNADTWLMWCACNEDQTTPDIQTRPDQTLFRLDTETRRDIETRRGIEKRQEEILRRGIEKRQEETLRRDEEFNVDE
ncbi:hypothetical protein Pmani_016113 [Petrolisthes manimaculis]|uniref:Uncharacterized protein n=1 Tax=Petrolisthes manimaculis TaxID=1843537 RepID=A0AAE1PR09_9EUCA|nr:hypothetical protein Pmani_016113 [Petrolisthes manimaculis]